MRSLLATLGYPVFQPLARSEVVEQPDEVFSSRASEADARGLYTEEGFVVLAGSSRRLNTVPSFQSHGFHRVREQSRELRLLVADGGRIRPTGDHLSQTPLGTAAGV